MNKGGRELGSLSEGLSWWSICEYCLVTSNCVGSIAEKLTDVANDRSVMIKVRYASFNILLWPKKFRLPQDIPFVMPSALWTPFYCLAAVTVSY